MADDEGTTGAVAAVTDRDDGWYRAVYEQHARHVLAYLLRRTSMPVAHDLLSEVFLVAWRRRQEAPGPAGRRAWLYGIAANVVRNQRRGERRRGRLLDRVARQRTPAAVGPADAVVATLVIRQALAQLRPADQEVLRLAAWEGCTTAEIADVLGCTPNAAAVRLHRARARLRRAYAAVQQEQPASLSAVHPEEDVR